MRRVAVIGAGWSGLACALALARSGRPVTLLDAAPQAGGRARRVEVALGDRRFALDNGQHLLIGAYSETLRLMRQIGVDPQQAFLRTPFALRYPDGFLLQAGRAPAPLHLLMAALRARGLRWSDRWALAMAVRRWKAARWQCATGSSAAHLLMGHPAVLIERLWRPLCIAALNVPLEDASACTFLAVLRDSLGAHAGASDLLLPRGDLSQLVPDAATARLGELGADLRLRTPIEALERCEEGWDLATRDGELRAHSVVLALPPERAAALLSSTNEAPLAPCIAQLRAVDYAPISTVYLRYPERVQLPHPVYALRDDPAAGHFGQWVFDRGALDGRCPGVLSVIVSARGPHEELPLDALAAAVVAQLAQVLQLPAPLAARTIEEKRATIVPAVGLMRPATRLGVPGLYLAGDAADSEYPSTIEGSVRSGLAAARAVLEDG